MTQMTTMRPTVYVKPTVEVTQIAVECGFAVSVTADGPWIEDPFLNTDDENIFNS